MNHWHYLTWLARQAIDGLAWAWPVTTAILLLMFGAIVGARDRLRHLLRLRTVWQLVPLLVPVIVLVLGTWFACEMCSPSSLGQGRRHYWAMWAANGLLIVQLVAAGFLIRFAAPLRLLAASFQVLLAWCSLWASFLAGMSMSGDWL
jgi:hypothetical protein